MMRPIFSFLRQRRLFEAGKSAEDRRVIVVTITDKGREANERIMNNFQNRFNVIIERGLEELERKISPEDMMVVKRALKELF